MLRWLCPDCKGHDTGAYKSQRPASQKPWLDGTVMKIICWAPAGLEKIRGKDKIRSVPSDGFKAATYTVAEKCMGWVYISGNEGREIRERLCEKDGAWKIR